ncbi:LytR C-terminal domain-containing protein, partial [Candidatus Woesebacteria bacterium]|nr:LytR C-terminal domain-containing protein [Candidatus Woesebacteria bacterium]
AGVAASAKEYLEGLGYKDVGVGNASSSDFTETEISIKDTKKDYLETLKSDLSKKYAVSAEAETLSSSSEFDTTVTIGSK